MRGAVPDDLRKDVLREMHDQHAQDVAKALQEHDVRTSFASRRRLDKLGSNESKIG